MKQEMQEFQTAFLSTCEGKSTERLWQEFKSEVDTLIKKYVPSKTLRGRKNLPWVTQEIRKEINLRPLISVAEELILILTEKDSRR